MNWNYRIIEYTKSNTTLYRIAEVYYKDDKPVMWTGTDYNPSNNHESVENLFFNTEEILKAFNKPILVEEEYEDERSEIISTDFIATKPSIIKEEPSAVAVILQNHVGNILSFTRSKDGHTGLPCGKVEKGESLIDAVKRECLEETGFTIEPSPKFFQKLEGDFRVYTFAGKILASNENGVDFTGEETQETSEGISKWSPVISLIEDSKFGEYNKEAFEFFEII